MVTCRYCLVTLCPVISLQCSFTELWLCTMVDILHKMDQVNLVIFQCRGCYSSLWKISFTKLIFLSGLISFTAESNYALVPRETTFIIWFWVSEWQHTQSWLVSQVMNEQAPKSAERQKSFFFSGPNLTKLIPLQVFNTTEALNLTATENIVRMKTALIKRGCWIPGKLLL